MYNFHEWCNVSKIVGVMLVLGLLMFSGSSVCAEEEIYIGVSAPLTGDNAEYGEYFRTSVLLAQELINSEGGIRGAQLKLVIEDSRAEPKEAVLVAQRFVSDSRILAVVGDFSSSASMAAAEIYNPSGLVQISPTASHPEFTKIGEYIFRSGTTQAQEAPFLAEWVVKDLGMKKVATIYLNNDWGLVANSNFVRRAKELGATVTNEESFIPGDKDFTAIITKMKQNQPELIFLGTMWTDGGLFATQMQKLGLKADLISHGGLTTEKLVEMAGKAVDGLRVSSFYFQEDPNPIVVDFTKRYQERYNKLPHTHCVLAYDALMLLANAIEQAGFDRAAIRDALAATDGYEGVSGDFNFDENGDPVKSFLKLRLQNDQWDLVEN